MYFLADFFIVLVLLILSSRYHEGRMGCLLVTPSIVEANNE